MNFLHATLSIFCIPGFIYLRTCTCTPDKTFPGRIVFLIAGKIMQLQTAEKHRCRDNREPGLTDVPCHPILPKASPHSTMESQGCKAAGLSPGGFTPPLRGVPVYSTNVSVVGQVNGRMGDEACACVDVDEFEEPNYCVRGWLEFQL